MEKSELRQRIMQRRSVIPAAKRKAWDDKIVSALWQLDAYKQANTIMIYLSFSNEINTWPLLTRAFAEGKQVAVPKLLKMPKEMTAVQITSKADLKPSLWGIYEPILDTPLSPRSIDLVVVPGLAFDRLGYRLGYGGGYYDRYLPQITGLKVALCYEEFVMDVPIMPWDQRVDRVLTESTSG